MFADSTPSAHSKTRTQLLLKYTMHFLPQSHSNSRSRDECFPKASAEHCKQGRMDTSSNWFQGIKTGLAAKQIRLVPVPALTRRQGYRAKMTQSHFILGGFVFFLSFSYILHSLAANFFVSGRLLPWPVTPSQGWKATYDKFFFFPDQKKLQNYLILHLFNPRRPWSLCIVSEPSLSHTGLKYNNNVGICRAGWYGPEIIFLYFLAEWSNTNLTAGFSLRGQWTLQETLDNFADFIQMLDDFTGLNVFTQLGTFQFL